MKKIAWLSFVVLSAWAGSSWSIDTGTLYITSNKYCFLTIDGKDVGEITREKSITVPVTFGEHEILFKQVGQRWSRNTWRSTITVDKQEQTPARYILLDGYNLNGLLRDQLFPGEDYLAGQPLEFAAEQKNTATATVDYRFDGRKYRAELSLDNEKWTLKKYYQPR